MKSLTLVHAAIGAFITSALMSLAQPAHLPLRNMVRIGFSASSVRAGHCPH